MKAPFAKPGDGITYLLSQCPRAPWPTGPLTALEQQIGFWDLFVEVSGADNIFQELLNSGSAEHIGRLLLSIRRGMALRAYAARADVPAPFIQTTPEIAALFYAQALPSILSKGHQS